MKNQDIKTTSKNINSHMCTKSYDYWIFDCLVIGSYWQADR